MKKDKQIRVSLGQPVAFNPVYIKLHTQILSNIALKQSIKFKN
jgi:hypothetical protein